jgi:hypothetical protein
MQANIMLYWILMYLLPLRADTYEDGATDGGAQASKQDEDMPAASTSNNPDGETHKEYPVIIKATNGKHAGNKAKKIKISTLVQPEDTDGFTLAYGSILKAHFSLTMRKKQKKRKDKEREKLTATAAAAADSKKKRKQTRGGLPKVIGPRRGAGHSKRQRTLKARAKAARKVLDKKQAREKDARFIAKLKQSVKPDSLEGQ